MIELVMVATAIVGTGIAAYTDFKTGIIPDVLNYILILIGIAALPMVFGWEALWYYALAAGVFVASLLFYLFGQLGGGDVKLFTGLTLLIPFYPKALIAINPLGPVTAPYPFIVSIFFLSALLSVVFVSTSYFIRLWRDRKKIKKFNDKIVKGLLLSLVFVPPFIVWYFINPRALIISPAIFLGLLLLQFKTDLLKRYVVIEKSVSKLNDDDVLALEVMSKSTVKKLGVGSRKTFLNFELDELKKNARKHGIKKVLVAEYLPKFGPYILISLLLNLALGDVFLWILFA